MSEFLLITDDPLRGERLGCDLATIKACHVHDLYEDLSEDLSEGAANGTLPGGAPKLIVSDIRVLSSDAIRRLRHILARVRGEGVPYLFLVHGNAARAQAQAQALGASGTLGASEMAQALAAALEGLHRHEPAGAAPADRHASAARRFLADVFVPGQLIAPAVIDTGTGLIARAVRETGVRDWITAVRRFDDATHQHCLLVAGLAAAFAQSLGFASADCHQLTKAVLLHDVGKIDVPREILNKPGKLTAAERAVIETHPARGHAMLAGRGFEDILLRVVRSHHEMLDGSGYPDRLKGAEIPDLIRLVTVCDIYGALIERRPYKPPMTGGAALAILEGMAGRVDIDLVRAFRPVAAAFAPPDSGGRAVA